MIQLDRILLNKLKKCYNIHSIQYGGHPNLDYAFGVCSFKEAKIYLKPILKKNSSKSLKVILHEAGHIYCYQNGLWKNYHITKNRLTEKQKSLIIKTGLKAERWIECWAEKELKKWDPKLRYNKYYYTNEKKKLFHEKYLQQFR